MKKHYLVLIATLMIAAMSAVMIREFTVYRDGGRPESAFLEYAFQWFFPRRDYTIADVAMDSAVTGCA